MQSADCDEADRIPMRGFEAVVELIRREGSPAVFAVLASTNSPYLAHGLALDAFPLVKTRHEETATAAAMAYSRATGKIGISSVQRGPGLANSVNALMVGKSVHAPAVVLVAESPATRSDTAKNVDQRSLVEAIGVGFHHAATPADLEPVFLEAVRAARWNGAPQVLSIGDPVLDGEVSLSAGDDQPAAPQVVEPDPDAIRAAVDAIERASRPLILAGHGAVHAECREELEQLAGLTGARVANSFYGSAFFSGHPHDLGLCGTWASRLVQEHLARTDVVIAFGASLNRHTTAKGTVFGGARIIHCEVDLDQPSASTSPELALLGDARSVAQAMIDEWKSRGLASREVLDETPTTSAIQRSVLGVELGHDPDRGLDPREVYVAFDRMLPDDRVVVTDSGRHLSPILSLMRTPGARSFLHSRGYGSVGLGMAAAIGAAVGHQGRRITLFCGDGGFTMAAQELDTIRRYELDLDIVIMNDLMYGAEVRYLREFGLPPDVLEMSFPDVEQLARAYGGRGTVVRRREDLASLELPEKGLFIVDVRVDPEVRGGDALG